MVEYMSYMFYRCSSLTSLDVSSFNTEKVYDMSYMFVGCSSLTNLDVSNFNTSKVTGMAGMFEVCTGLTTLDLSNFNTRNVRFMNAMFWCCSGLKTIYTGKDWNTGNVTYSLQMFYGCENLVGEKGTKYDESHVDAEYARIDKGANRPGYFSSKVYAVINDDTMSFYCDTCRYSREGTVYSLDIVWWNTPEWCWDKIIKNITTVRFDSTFADVRPKSTSSWFEEMKNLTTIIGMEYLNTSEAYDISYMFAECSSLKNIDLSHFDTSNVNIIACLFKN
jgi:surface protein